MCEFIVFLEFALLIQVWLAVNNEQQHAYNIMIFVSRVGKTLGIQFKPPVECWF
jgi:hypothetical protein